MVMVQVLILTIYYDWNVGLVKLLLIDEGLKNALSEPNKASCQFIA